MAIDLSMSSRDMGMVRGDTPGGRRLRVSHTVCRSVETDLRYHRNRSKLSGTSLRHNDAIQCACYSVESRESQQLFDVLLEKLWPDFRSRETRSVVGVSPD